MTMLASQITSLTVVYSIVYSGVNQIKHQSSASLAFVREIHRGPVNFPHKWPVTRKMFPFDDVIMYYSSLTIITVKAPNLALQEIITYNAYWNPHRSANHFDFDWLASSYASFVVPNLPRIDFKLPIRVVIIITWDRSTQFKMEYMFGLFVRLDDIITNVCVIILHYGCYTE